jgi:hypothetical protein
MPDRTLGSEAIKMACIQTTPGQESSVVSRFTEFLSAQKTPFSIHKGFGTFDIIVLYSTPSFDYYFSDAGPINGIVKSNLFSCFPHFGTNSKNIFSSLNKNAFTAICLLKMDPASHKLFTNLEMGLVKYVRQRNKDLPSLHVLGTLGWTEIILLISGADLDDIFNRLKEIISLRVMHGRNRKIYSVFLKTYSILSINYKFLPPNSHYKNYEKCINYFSSGKVYASNKNRLLPDIHVSCRPGTTKNITKYWVDKGFKVSRVLGITDILISPNKKVKLGPFLGKLLYFRHNYSEDVLSTSTHIRTEAARVIKDISKISQKPVGKTSYSTNTLKKYFGRKWGYQLSNDLYSLTQLINNPIVGDSFRGMSQYPRYLVRIGKLKKDSPLSMRYASRAEEAFASNASKAIRSGAELRTYGTYGTVEEVSGRFSRVRGGAQRCVLASEFLINSVLKNRLDSNWFGFVISDNYKFFHIGSVLNIPTESLFDPFSWWALYHEIGHVYSQHDTELLNPRSDPIKLFVENKHGNPNWIKLLSELIAEVIGYELGFYGDYKFFAKKLWDYITSLGDLKDIPIGVYLVRTFYVYLYHLYFQVNAIKREDWYNTDFLYDKFIEHIEFVEKRCKIQIRDKRFLVSENLINIRDLLPVTEFWFKILSERTPNFLPDKLHLESKNTKDVFDRVSNGQIYWEPVRHPEAILYLLLRGKKHPLNVELATIITFWKQQISLLYAK